MMVAAPRSAVRLGLLAAVLALIIYLFPQVDSGRPGRFQQAFGSSSLKASHQERVDLAVKLQVLKHLLEERFPYDNWRSARALNGLALDRLSECTLAGTCGPGESTVVVLASYHFGNSLAGHVSGEDIWAHSTILAFESLNYTLLYTYSALETLQIHQQIPDLIPAIIFEGATLEECIKRNAETEADTDDKSSPSAWQKPDRIGCIKKPGFEEGIPIWKGFVFHFWQGPATPMGGNWTLAPEDWSAWQHRPSNQYLGYSIEDRCTQIPVYSEREHRALILAKNAPMLQGKDFAWTGLLDGVAKDLPKDNGNPFQFVSTAGKSVADGGPEELPEKGIVSMGKMPQLQWWNEVAKSKAMLGVGRPWMSPSPYDAMCFGVPFINVILNRDEKDPKNKDKWQTMHDALIALDPPNVYHVMQNDREGLEEALERAIKHPIGRYIPPWMTLESVRERHRVLVEGDWKSRAETYMAEKWKDGDCPFLL